MPRVEQTVPMGESPFYMKGGVVFHAETHKRAIRSPQDFGMFDGNPDIAEKRARTLPPGTKIY